MQMDDHVHTSFLLHFLLIKVIIQIGNSARILHVTDTMQDGLFTQHKTQC
jgi:hypothetical protein